MTAIDLLVGFEPQGLRKFTGKHRLSRDFVAADLSVEQDGAERTIVATEKVEDGVPVASEPWRSVVVFDRAGSRTRALRWGAALLAERVDDLIRLGDVEVLVLDPGGAPARVVVPRTRQAGVLRSALSNLALELDGQDGLAGLRYELRRRDLDATSSTGFMSETAKPTRGDREAVYRAEVSRVLQHQDELLAALEDRSVGTGPRRCLFWITGGFDVDPHLFYGLDPVGESAADPSGTGSSGLIRPRLPDLAAESEAFSRSLAAYGWVTIPMIPPQPDPLRGKGRGARVGKMRFLGPAATYEAERRPDRAEAYLELADAQRAAGKLEKAAEAYDRAYYHFWGDPRTKQRQAVALAGEAAMLEALGRTEEARKSYEMAEKLDPSALPKVDNLRPTGRLHGPRIPLLQVASDTSGQVVSTTSALAAVLDDLAIRLRVTYQVEGDADGHMAPVWVRWEGHDDALVRSARWARSGTPERLDRARARLALKRPALELGEGIIHGRREVLTVDPLALGESGSGGGLRVALHTSLGDGWPPSAGHLRLTLADGGVLDSLAPSAQWTMPGRLDGSRRDQVSEVVLHGVGVALLWRDLETGRWGGLRLPTGLPGSGPAIPPDRATPSNEPGSH